MNLRLIRLFFTSGIFFGCHAIYAQTCPALDANGRTFKLAPPQSAITHPHKAIPIEQKEAVDIALRWVGKYEAGGADPWTNVSGQEEISVGFMQWNWRTGSIIAPFIANIPQEVVDSAPPSIRNGVQILKKLSKNQNDKSIHAEAKKIIKEWSTEQPNDPLVKGRLRRSIVKGWGEWLGNDALRAIQRSLIDKNVNEAYSYALAWQTDNGIVAPPDVRTIAFFFDAVTFNGGVHGVWVEQVKAFRKRFINSATAVEEAARWLAQCPTFVSPLHVAQRKMYGRTDAERTVQIWRKSIARHSLDFSDAQINLLVQALLRAQQSNGSDPPSGFPGIYQADVLTRAGTIALGQGVVHGDAISKFP